MSGSDSGLWFSGDIRIARYSNGVLGGFSDPINASKLEITHSGDKVQRISNGRDDQGEAIETRYMKKPTEFSIGFDEGHRELLAMAVLGTASAYSQSAAEAQSATVTLVLDQWVSLGKYNVSNVTITDKVLGTDFDLHGRLGLIKALKEDMVGSQTVNFDVGAIAGDKIVAGTDRIIDLSILMDVMNNADGQPGILTIPKVSVLPSTALALISQEYSTLEFSGDVIKMPGQDLYTFLPNLAFS